MSGLKKSASFRSKIPISKPVVQPRQCYSPPVGLHRKKLKLCERNRKRKNDNRKRYVTSSDSSSDESGDSEMWQFQVIIWICNM